MSRQADKPKPDKKSDDASHIPKLPAVSTQKDIRLVKSSQALQIALLALLERKPLEHITVREIAAEAQLHHATFYRHQLTKEGLLDLVAADQVRQLVQHTQPLLGDASGYAVVEALWKYVSDHRILWTALITGGAAGTIRSELLRVSRQVMQDVGPQNSVLPAELAVNYSVSLIFETFSWWLSQPTKTLSTEHVARALHRLLAAIQDEAS